jgi:hypothetical protein
MTVDPKRDDVGWPPRPRQSVAQPSDSVSRDQLRTMDRYNQAGALLRKAIERRGRRWTSLDLPTFAREPECFDDMQLLTQINSVLDAQRNTSVNKTPWEQCKRALQCICTATSPFGTILLAVAHNGSSVNGSMQCNLTSSSLTLTDSSVPV